MAFAADTPGRAGGFIFKPFSCFLNNPQQSENILSTQTVLTVFLSPVCRQKASEDSPGHSVPTVGFVSPGSAVKVTQRQKLPGSGARCGWYSR